jgi:hypothetical protein
MTLRPALRKLVLTLHLVLSLGWIGAVLAYLALDFVVADGDAQLARAAYLALGTIGQSVIIPLALGSWATGLLISLTTPWGLFRHYWVLISFVLTTFAVVVLLEHIPGVAAAADALRRSDAATSHGSVRPDFEHAVGGLVVLLVVTFLNVYKPRGLTRYGWRRRLDATR